MPQVHVKKSNTKKILVLVAVLLLCLGVIGAVSFWEAGQEKEAMSVQAEIDESARRRREGWIERDGVWYAPKQGQETMLLIGLDKMDPLKQSEGYNNNTQADFLLLAVFDDIEEKVHVLHINRDSMAEIPVLGVDGQPAGSVTGQLALAYTYGSGLNDSCVNTVDAVSDFLYGIEIDHYVAMTMGAIPYLNDLIGGVEVTVLDDFSGIDDSLVEGETITLKGEQALHYVRTISPEQLAQIAKYILSDCSIDTLSRMSEQFGTYKLQELQDIQGEAVQGEEYIEYYVDEDALAEQVLELFYEEK